MRHFTFPKDRFVAKAPSKPIVFISHISEEREIANALKKLIEDQYGGMVEVFVSTSPESIQPGQKWLDRINDALTACKLEIIIASPTSLRRPWVNFEAGAGWVREIPVIPICHSGMTFSKLPKPLDSFQAAIATDETTMNQIFTPIANAIGGRVPDQIDFTDFIQVVKSFEALTTQNESMAAVSGELGGEGLTVHERATLLEASELGSSPNDLLITRVLEEAVERLGFRKVAVRLAIKMLERREFIELVEEYDDFNRSNYWMTRVTDYGWRWLEDNLTDTHLQIPPRISSHPPEQKTASSDEVPF
jgi:hypothetical protein